MVWDNHALIWPWAELAMRGRAGLTMGWDIINLGRLRSGPAMDWNGHGLCRPWSRPATACANLGLGLLLAVLAIGWLAIRYAGLGMDIPWAGLTVIWDRCWLGWPWAGMSVGFDGHVLGETI
jgi:hypothetical protein